MRGLIVFLAIMSLSSVAARAQIQIGVIGGQHMEKTEFCPPHDAHGPVRDTPLYVEPMLSAQHPFINVGVVAGRAELVGRETSLSLSFGDALQRGKFDGARL